MSQEEGSRDVEAATQPNTALHSTEEPNTVDKESLPPTSSATRLTGQWTDSGKIDFSQPSPERQQTLKTEEEEGGGVEIDVIVAEDIRKEGEGIIMSSRNNIIDDENVETIGHFVDPPPTRVEHFRDALLSLLDGKVFQLIGIVVLIGVILDGAVFFFFLMGWQTVCRPRTDCSPRNEIYNISVQILNVFFTYMGLVSLPWRLANFLHVTGWQHTQRKNEPGYDLYGLPTMDIWFHLSKRQRTVILTALIFNCLFQFTNQGMRIVYYNYELQATWPGVLWVNLFFASSFLVGFFGGSMLMYFSHLKRLEEPGKFGPGPRELAQQLWDKHVRGRDSMDVDDDEEEEEPSRDSLSPRYNHPDPTRAKDNWEATKVDRAEMRLFAM